MMRRLIVKTAVELREAIREAASLPDGAEIFIPHGTVIDLDAMSTKELFRVVEPSGKTYRLYTDGHIAGFEPGAVVVNKFPIRAWQILENSSQDLLIEPSAPPPIEEFIGRFPKKRGRWARALSWRRTIDRLARYFTRLNQPYLDEIFNDAEARSKRG